MTVTSFRQKVLLISISTIFTVLLLEGMVRVMNTFASSSITAWKPEEWKQVHERRSDIFTIPKELWYLDLERDPIFLKKNIKRWHNDYAAHEYNYLIETGGFNDVGFRLEHLKEGDTPRRPETAKGRQVWLFGDSFIFGYGSESTKTISANLARVGVNSFNFGVSGTSPVDYINLFKHHVTLAKEKPKVVIIGIYSGNDFPIATVNNEPMCCSILLRITNSFEHRLLHNSALYEFVNDRIMNIYNKKFPKDDFHHPDEFPVPQGYTLSDNGHANLKFTSARDWRIYCKLFEDIPFDNYVDTKFVIVSIPTKGMIFNARHNPARIGEINEAANEFGKLPLFKKFKNIIYWDLTDEILKDQKSWYFKRDPHLNEYGNQKAAERLKLLLDSSGYSKS